MKHKTAGIALLAGWLLGSVLSAAIAPARAAKPPADGAQCALATAHCTSVVRTQALDSALELLEAGNPFISRYNQLTGAAVTARFAAGLPYFFGGQLEHALMQISKAWQDSRHFKKGCYYVYGYDCIGFTRHVYRHAGLAHPKSILDMLNPWDNAASQIDLAAIPFARWPDALAPGDLLALRGRTNHIMMYIGTLRHFGYTYQEAGPCLAPYLDYPLFIHCGNNPGYVQRYAKYIAQLQARFAICNTDGGVNVTLVGPPLAAAPFSATLEGITHHFFALEGYALTVYDLAQKSLYVGWHPLPRQQPRQAAPMLLPQHTKGPAASFHFF